MRWPRGAGRRLCFGGDYNPDQWPPEVRAQDLTLMREAGVNLVSLGVFSWSTLEPEPGRYDFGWLDEIMDALHDNGIGVALATPTASPPPWFGRAHPDALTVERDGTRMTYGSRDTYCLSAPAYRDAAVRVAGALAERYAQHPALAMWHVHNEYGTPCHCDHAAAAFRTWLRHRYSTLDRLAEAWTTAFWSQGYADWAEVLPPRATRYLPNPTQELDFRRFVSDELRAGFREQRDVLHALAPDVPVTTNVVFDAWVPVDHGTWADDVDLVAVDCYPSVGGVPGQQQAAFVADLARSWAGGRQWLLMEQSPNLFTSGVKMLGRPPGELARMSLAHIARGSRGAMFFQWRGSRGGAEMYHGAMVPHAGPDSRVFREVTALGRLLGRLADAGLDLDDPEHGDPPVVDADVAVMFDAPSWWALQTRSLPAPMDYLRGVRSVHGALWRSGTTTDIVRPGADLSGYRVLCVPHLYAVDDAAAAAVEAFVVSGGTVVVWYLSGTADTDLRIGLGGYAGAFAGTLGIRVEEFHPLPSGTRARLSNGDTGSHWSEDIQLISAEAHAHHVGGLLDGRPAVTRNRHGSGTAWYVSMALDGPAMDRLLATVLAEAGVAPAGTAPGVEVVRRRSGTTTWLFAVNHTDTAHDVPADGLDVVTGADVTGSIRLEPGAHAVVRLTARP